MPVQHPILAQETPRTVRQRHIPVFFAFATPDMHQQSGTVQIGHLEMGAFGQAQPARIDRRQTHPIVRKSDHLKEALYLVV